jgi:hypothetical protein
MHVVFLQGGLSTRHWVLTTSRLACPSCILSKGNVSPEILSPTLLEPTFSPWIRLLWYYVLSQMVQRKSFLEDNTSLYLCFRHPAYWRGANGRKMYAKMWHPEILMFDRVVLMKCDTKTLCLSNIFLNIFLWFFLDMQLVLKLWPTVKMTHA